MNTGEGSQDSNTKNSSARDFVANNGCTLDLGLSCYIYDIGVFYVARLRNGDKMSFSESFLPFRAEVTSLGSVTQIFATKDKM